MGRHAACTGVMWRGARTALRSCTHTRSASTPSCGPPRRRATASGLGGPPIQSITYSGHTRSPAAKRVTPAPTASTSPQASDSGTTGSGKSP